MAENKQYSRLTTLKKIRDMLINNDSENIAREEYKTSISNTIEKIIDELSTLNDDKESISNDFFNNDKEKDFILEVLDNVFYEKGYRTYLFPTEHTNKEIVQDALCLISEQLYHKDYSYPSTNDYSYIYNRRVSKGRNNSTDFLNDEKPKNKERNKRNRRLRPVQLNRLKLRKRFKLSAYSNDILNEHLDIMNYVNKYRDSFNLWQDDNDFFYITKFEQKVQKGDKNKISKLLSTDLQKDILIVDDIREINKNKNKENTSGYFPIYLLSNKIPKVYENFNPLKMSRFYQTSNQSWVRNTFEYSSYLKLELPKRYVVSSVIMELLKNMTNNNEEYMYILNWLGYFYQTLQKSNAALVLIGDNEVSEDIFYTDIIKPIFGLKFCSTINDDIIKNVPITDIVKDKIFYHFITLSSSMIKLKKTKKLIREVLIKDKIENIPIYGQTLITLNSNNDSCLLNIKSRCSIIKIKSLDSIIEQFGYADTLTLYANIEGDLSNFSSILAAYPTDDLLANSRLSSSESQVEIEDIDSKIDDFINAIKYKKEIYFKKIEDKDIELYDELLYNFNDDMVARPVLNIYFNIIHEKTIFFKNDDLLKILKEKDDFFKQNINKSIQYKKKKRYSLPSD